MALPDILPLNTFADRLKIRSVVWQLQRFDEISGLAGGDILAAQLMQPKWSGTVTLAPMYHAEAAQVQALVESLDGPMRAFYLYAPQMPNPQAYDGHDLSGVTIGSVGSNNRAMTLAGLPEGFTVTVGDSLAFDYGSNPTRRAFHRILETRTATALGNTSLFEVRPHFRPGVQAGLAVTLIKPAAKVFIMPGSFNPGTAEGVVTSGMSFEVMQRP